MIYLGIYIFGVIFWAYFFFQYAQGANGHRGYMLTMFILWPFVLFWVFCLFILSFVESFYYKDEGIEELMKNDEYWQEIESLPAFAEETPNNEKLWHWLEEFQKAAGRSLNARSLILLKALLTHMHDVGHSAGYTKGHEAAEYNDTGST